MPVRGSDSPLVVGNYDYSTTDYQPRSHSFTVSHSLTGNHKYSRGLTSSKFWSSKSQIPINSTESQ